jgi:hypothetical protein
MHLVSIIIPIAPYHTTIVEQAIAAARSQSLSCDVIPVEDANQLGTGWARNMGVALSDSLFVVFCDADDILRQDAIERMVGCYQQGKYVYIDSMDGEGLHQTSDLGYYDSTWWHVVTSLIPTAAFKAVGGFDESLPAIEDMELFLRLQAHGICGVRCPHPLLRYTAGGRRSMMFKKRPDYKIFRNQVYEKWSGAAKMSCGCGTPVNGVIPENKQDTDILVTALYGTTGPRQIVGPVTGRLYSRPRGASSYQLWVDPRDADAKPNLWQPVRTVDMTAMPAVDEVVRMAAEAMRS